MSLFARLSSSRTYSVEQPEAGRVVYREGNHEYVFPVYEEDGSLVLVDVPSEQRIRFFFGWHWHPHQLPPASRARILARIAAHYAKLGASLRVFDRAGEQTFVFYPELFTHRARAMERLAEAGLDWFAAYDAVDLLHEEYGLEITGIPERAMAERILRMLARTFPQWHHHELGLDRDSGWEIALYMFPAESRENTGWADSEKDRER
ncbi:MAG: hypothetical protein AB1705_05715 [Verrucomicrobiota bacterium]